MTVLSLNFPSGMVKLHIDCVCGLIRIVRFGSQMRKRRRIPKITVKCVDLFCCFRKAVRRHIKRGIPLNKIKVKMFTLLRCPECHDKFFCYHRIVLMLLTKSRPGSCLIILTHTFVRKMPDWQQTIPTTLWPTGYDNKHHIWIFFRWNRIKSIDSAVCLLNMAITNRKRFPIFIL